MTGKVVITEGIIGVGKTTFSEALSKYLDAQWMREPDEKAGNPYLARFYDNPKRWALTMQLHLLNTRYRMHMHAQWCTMQTQNNVVIDRSYFGDTAFANLQLQMGTLTQDEYDTYSLSYHNMTSHVLLPQVCIYLDVQPIVSQTRVQHRMEAQTGRKCETAIDLEYLINLQNHQDQVIRTLRNQGVHVIELDWNENKTLDEIHESAKKIALQINALPGHSFLDLHRRTI